MGVCSIWVYVGVIVDGECVYVDVWDQGSGILLEYQGFVFELFFIIDKSGIGFGFYLVWELCEVNQVYLFLVDDNQFGCCFCIIFVYFG